MKFGVLIISIILCTVMQFAYSQESKGRVIKVVPETRMAEGTLIDRGSETSKSIDTSNKSIIVNSLPLDPDTFKEQSASDKSSAVGGLATTGNEYTSLNSEQVIENDSLWVKKGTFQENIEILTSKLGFQTVIWSPHGVEKKCIWNQVTEYPIPKKEPLDAISYYAKTQDFYLQASSVDNHLKLTYIGAPQRLKDCLKN